MADSRRRSRGALLDTIDTITMWGLQLGGPVFVISVGYLLWGMFAGSVGNVSSMPSAEQARLWANVQLACKVLTISGFVALASAGARYYTEEVIGYIFLISGASLYWGVPIVLGSAIRVGGTTGAAPTSPIGFAVSQIQLVGLVAVGAAVPFIIADFWYKLRGMRRSAPRGAVVVSKEQQGIPKSRLYIFCWQMPYCRDYLRKFCKAYEQKKSCWRIKSGCYCDEDLILRVMKKDGADKIAGFDQRFSQAAGKSSNLTAAQKRERCRQCFLYTEHQKQKYRLLSPLAFPITVGLMWMYLKPVKTFLSKAIEFTDQFAGRMSFGHGQDALGQQWSQAPATSETVLWIFLICIGLIIVTYVLRAIEYAVFDLQV